MTDDPLARSRAFWLQAANFPANKEDVYPEHADAQEFDLHTGKDVLEYGCGGGSDALSYLRRGNRVWAFDIVPGNVMRTIERVEKAGFSDLLKAFCGDAEWTLPRLHQLPYLDEAFDVVSAHGVLHHIQDPDPVVKEFYRVLKPGGLVYVMLYTEKLRDNFVDQMQKLRATYSLTPEEAFGWCTDGSGCPYARAYTEEEGRALLERAGFVVTRAFTFNSGFFRTFRGVKSV